MVSTDPISDMLTRIRNSIMVNKTIVEVPYSKIKESIAKLLKDSGFINDVKVDGKGIAKKITITINQEDRNAVITEISRMSTPGRRWYVKSSNIPTVKQGRGIVIVSTSRGLMLGVDAKAEGLGGELICKVY